MAGLLETYWLNLQDKLKIYNTAKSDVEAYYASPYAENESWYNQLVKIQAWNSQPQTWIEFEPTWNRVYSTYKQKQVTADKAFSDYEIAKGEYETAKKELATPGEVAAAEQVEIANAALLATSIWAETQSAQAKLTADEQAALRKKIIGYVLTGVLIIAIVAVGFWAYKKYIKKK